MIRPKTICIQLRLVDVFWWSTQPCRTDVMQIVKNKPVSHHKGRIETDTELSNYVCCLRFIFSELSRP